jgi:hypothetical protein
MPARPVFTADEADKVLWLLETHAYFAGSDVVVELFEPSANCVMKPSAFAKLFRAWRQQVIGPQGGVTWRYATNLWDVSPVRHAIRGIRMRPDKPFPCYKEDGVAYKNTYRQIIHDGAGGDIKMWHEFMEHLLPDPIEREWFINWLAHKWRNPAVPGVAVIMVASGPDGPVYGAGRGMLRDVLARLLGPRYVRTVDFDIFTGKSAQAVYSDWAAYSLLITVSEAKDTADAGRWSEKRAVYERLKEIVDPRPVMRTFTVKGFKEFEALAFASYLVFSNNRDALQIPDGDRRVTALANGTQMPAEMAVRLQAWMDQPGNIAELARFLEARDLSQFNAYAPLETATKTTMQELSRSELDDAFALVRRQLGKSALFTGEQISEAVRSEVGDGSEDMRKAIKRWIRAECTQLKTFRMVISAGRQKILCWRDRIGIEVSDENVARELVKRTQKILDQASEAPPSATVTPIVDEITGRPLDPS